MIAVSVANMVISDIGLIILIELHCITLIYNEHDRKLCIFILFLYK